MSGAGITQEAIKTSYTQLFGRHFPDILYYQRDRPHYYNLFLKGIALVVLIVAVPILTLLPIYPLLYILLMYSFDGTAAFSSGTGRMNVLWIVVLYFYYIFGFSKMSGKSSGGDLGGSIGFTSLFMGLTPILLFLTWFYAAPVSIHDTLASTFNGLTGASPFLRGGIGFTNMRCAGDVVSRIESLAGGGAGGIEQVGGGLIEDIGGIFGGIGLSGLAIIALLSLVVGGLLFLFWARFYIEQTGADDEQASKLNTQPVKIIKHIL
jgi:hypothetical protein